MNLIEKAIKKYAIHNCVPIKKTTSLCYSKVSEMKFKKKKTEIKSLEKSRTFWAQPHVSSHTYSQSKHRVFY